MSLRDRTNVLEAHILAWQAAQSDGNELRACILWVRLARDAKSRWKLLQLERCVGVRNTPWRCPIVYDSPRVFAEDFDTKPTAGEIATFISHSSWNYGGNWPGLHITGGGNSAVGWRKTTGEEPQTKPHREPKIKGELG